ncbi:MAG: 5-oxoprolinase subunit PxpB [Desulfovermiculus sp.]|nr:5-oxoprolinase subunit PxpB [Desulfovermiculus sp.]
MSHLTNNSSGHVQVQPMFRLSGDRGLLVEFGTSIDPDMNRLTRNVAQRLERMAISGVLDVVPAYASFLVIYDPDQIGVSSLQETVLACWDQADPAPENEGATVDIPVCYSESFGPDLPNVAEHNGLTPDQVIQIHTAGRYLIYMIGFAPGFPYLGGLDHRLHTPRLDTPRPKVEAGSVGIANNQTGIYPISSPGGWQIIGRTPLRLFVPEAENPVPYYRPGDSLRFVSISESEFHRLVREQDHG